MNDPRYVDATHDAGDLLDQGFTKFILDLGGVRESGSSFLSTLLTMMRRIRQQGGEAVLAQQCATPNVERVLYDMREWMTTGTFSSPSRSWSVFHEGSGVIAAAAQARARCRHAGSRINRARRVSDRSPRRSALRWDVLPGAAP